jgi:parallel beta-helix repeat protein
MKLLLLTLLLAGIASAACIEPTDGMVIRESVSFCSSSYDVHGGISIVANGITLDCGTAILRGVVGESEIGIRAENVDGITIRNCNVVTFNQGLYLKNVTNSLIEDNAMLKNRIGIRMLDSYENTIRDNSDKSFQVAVSAINSKFNVVMLGNKDIERAFCEVNACNEYRDMNVCESGDFYCSKKCTAQTDGDCAQSTPAPAIELKEESKSAEDIIAEAEKEAAGKTAEEPEAPATEKRKLSFAIKLFIYLALYFVAFIVLRLKKR